MKNISIERQGTRTFLVYEISVDDSINSTTLGMLTNNPIKGFATASFTQMNDSKFVKYDISSRVSAKQFLNGILNKKQIISFFKGISECYLTAEDYMIDAEALLLDQEHIFVDSQSGEPMMICIPVDMPEQSNVKYAEFFKDIVCSAQLSQMENREYVAELIGYLNRSDIFSFEEFKKLLVRIENPSAEQPKEVAHKFREPSVQVSVHPVPAPAPQTEPPVKRQHTPVASQRSAQQGRVEQPVSVPKKNDVGFAIPGMGSGSDKPLSSNDRSNMSSEVDDSSEKISLLYLLNHYSKENAEKYKAQKAQSKGAKPKKAEDEDHTGYTEIPEPFHIPGSSRKQYNSLYPSAPAGSEQSQKRKSGVAAELEQRNGGRPDILLATPRDNSITPHASGVMPAYGEIGSNSLGFGDTEYFGNNYEDEGTIIMDPDGVGEQRIIPYLVRKKNNERIPINKGIYRIGRDPEFSDYEITENRYVGHSHCHIVLRNGEYFVVDENSKNHTYVDGIIVPAGQEVKIAHGQILRVADEEFEFKIF